MNKGLYSATSDGEGGITYTDESRGLPYVGIAIEAKAKAANAPGYAFSATSRSPAATHLL